MSYAAAPVWLGYSGTPLPHPKPKQAVLIDLDGTFLNNEHRQHHMQGDKKNWAAFFNAMRDDTAYPQIKFLADLIFKHTEVAVLLVTGRPSQHHGMTLQSLHDLGISFTALIMRAQTDNRSDVEVKKDMLRGIMRMGYEPMLCIDDRPEVVHMWREHGVFTLACDPRAWDAQVGVVDRADKLALLDENQRLKERVAELEEQCSLLRMPSEPIDV